MAKFIICMCVTLCALFGIAERAEAQVLVAKCDLGPGLSYVLDSSMVLSQVGFPSNRGQAVRDVSMQTFALLPSTIVGVQYFLTWGGQVVQIVPGVSWKVVGLCAFAGIAPPRPQLPAPPVLDPAIGVETANGVLPLPPSIVDPDRPLAPPMIAKEADVRQCREDTYFDEPFQNCVVKAMAGEREYAAYDCAREHKDDATELSVCMVSALGGEKEQAIAAQFDECYQQYGDSYSDYPQCLAGKDVHGEIGLLISCLDRQKNQGDVSAMGTAVCYGTEKLNLNLNPEMQIAVECAVATDGQPEAFAGCAGGLLTKRELEKCTKFGIGGDDGCFGKNNDIVKYMKARGLELAEIYGPANPIVHQWNDFVDLAINGSRDAALNAVNKVTKNVMNTTAQAGHDTVKEIGKVLPRVRIKVHL